MNPQAIRALGYVVKTLRPNWPKELIEDALMAAQAKRPFADVAADAVDAALDLKLTKPGVLATHRRVSKPTTTSQQPPHIRDEPKNAPMTDADHQAAIRAITAMKANRKPKDFRPVGSRPPLDTR